MALYPFLQGGYEQVGQAVSYGSLRRCGPRWGGTTVEGAQQRSVRVSVALFREDIVYAFLVACPVEGSRHTVCGGTEKRVYQVISRT